MDLKERYRSPLGSSGDLLWQTEKCFRVNVYRWNNIIHRCDPQRLANICCDPDGLYSGFTLQVNLY